jgi:predicted ATPase/class 3 adenylate cyclase/Tfp pilus assembly protein PilF
MEPTASLPTGTVTFLFTDIEGSTRLLQHLGDEYPAVLAEHHRLLRASIQQCGGCEIDTAGDGFFVVFPRADQAVMATLAAQQALLAHPWPEGAPVRVRMGLHTGEPVVTSTGYVGMDVHRGARIAASGHGGQVILSQTTHDLVQDELPQGVSLLDLGPHRLKDLQRPEQLYQLLHPDLPARFPPLKSLDSHPNNLPTQLTTFVGREREMSEVEALLKTTRLLTLTGPGGAGKTRLSLQVAANVLHDYADGVWLVELAPLADPALVAQEITSALGGREEPGRPLSVTLTEYLKPRSLLLLLDNCEHLAAACAQTAAALLRACPKLCILATSRERLDVPGETLWRVPSLSLPDPRRLPRRRGSLVASLTRYESVRLFVDRSASILPSFAVTEENALAVAQVCRRLDGIPLAIELAAARVRVLSVEQITARLDDRFKLLTGGSRTLLPRQQTLRALIDWSYDLLSEAERIMMRRLVVFAGGWMLEAAEAVCAGEGVEEYEVLDLLTQLVDKSLILVDDQARVPRYHLQETIREYGREYLSGSGEEAVLRERHRDWYLQLAEQAEPQFQGSEQAIWLNRLETEHDNLRAALGWCVEQGEAEAGLRLGAALGPFWSVRGYLTEGRDRLAELLALPGAEARTTLRLKALHRAGLLAHRQGEYESARSLFKESLGIARELGDEAAIAALASSLGRLALAQGAYAEAQPLFEESLALSREAGDKRGIASALNEMGRLAQSQEDDVLARSLFEQSLVIRRELGDRWGIAVLLNNLGCVSQNQSDLEAARSFYEESLTIWRELGDNRNLAISLLNLALVAQQQDDHEQAASRYQESLVLFQELGDRFGIAACLKELGGLATAQRQPERASRLYAAAHVLREAIGVPLPPADATEYERCLAANRDQLGDAAFAAAWEGGCAMPLEQIISFAVETAARGG